MKEMHTMYSLGSYILRSKDFEYGLNFKGHNYFNTVLKLKNKSKQWKIVGKNYNLIL